MSCSLLAHSQASCFKAILSPYLQAAWLMDILHTLEVNDTKKFGDMRGSAGLTSKRDQTRLAAENPEHIYNIGKGVPTCPSLTALHIFMIIPH